MSLVQPECADEDDAFRTGADLRPEPSADAPATKAAKASAPPADVELPRCREQVENAKTTINRLCRFNADALLTAHTTVDTQTFVGLLEGVVPYCLPSVEGLLDAGDVLPKLTGLADMANRGGAITTVVDDDPSLTDALQQSERTLASVQTKLDLRQADLDKEPYSADELSDYAEFAEARDRAKARRDKAREKVDKARADIAAAAARIKVDPALITGLNASLGTLYTVYEDVLEVRLNQDEARFELMAGVNRGGA